METNNRWRHATRDQLGVALAELVNDLLGAVMFPFHRELPPPAAATPLPRNGLP